MAGDRACIATDTFGNGSDSCVTDVEHIVGAGRRFRCAFEVFSVGWLWHKLLAVWGRFSLRDACDENVREHFSLGDRGRYGGQRRA